MQKPAILEALRSSMAEREQRTEITQDKVMADIDLVRANAMAADGDGKMANHTAALKALELQGKHLGMWIERQKIDMTATVTTIARRIIDPKDPSGA